MTATANVRFVVDEALVAGLPRGMYAISPVNCGVAPSSEKARSAAKGTTGSISLRNERTDNDLRDWAGMFHIWQLARSQSLFNRVQAFHLLRQRNIPNTRAQQIFHGLRSFQRPPSRVELLQQFGHTV